MVIHCGPVPDGPWPRGWGPLFYRPPQYEFFIILFQQHQHLEANFLVCTLQHFEHFEGLLSEIFQYTIPGSIYKVVPPKNMTKSFLFSSKQDIQNPYFCNLYQPNKTMNLNLALSII